MKKCIVCEKKVEKGITKGGRFFCCPECVKHYEDEHKSDTKDEVCEFC
jgi:hypothetical protein